MDEGELLAIGTLAARTGVTVTAVRFYERKGLITSIRTKAGHRRFHRSMIRRLSVIVVCQRLGYSLSELGERLADLPTERVPDDADWVSLTDDFRSEIDDRVERLLALRDQLDGCIGCGCVSLEACTLYNPGDAAAGLGAGPRYLLGDSSADLPNNLPSHKETDMTETTETSKGIDEAGAAGKWHLAQINIGRLVHPVDDPRSADFMNNLDPINALGEGSPGFVWRLQDDSGNATAIRAFDDETILPNLTVWESLDALKDFVFRTDHARFMQRRREWFLPMDDLPVLTMWWIPAGHLPTLEEAKERIDHLAEHGPTQRAFGFRPVFDPPNS